MGRPNVVVAVSAAEAEQLRSIARSRSLPHSLVRRARIVLMSAEGIANQIIAERCGLAFQPSVIGGAAGGNAALPDCMGNCVQDGRAPMATRP